MTARLLLLLRRRRRGGGGLWTLLVRVDGVRDALQVQWWCGSCNHGCARGRRTRGGRESEGGFEASAVVTELRRADGGCRGCWCVNGEDGTWWCCGGALQRLGVPPRGGQKRGEDGVHGGTVVWCRFRRGQEVAAMAAGAKMVAAGVVQWCAVTALLDARRRWWRFAVAGDSHGADLAAMVVRWPVRLAAAAVWRVEGKLGLGFHV